MYWTLKSCVLLLYKKHSDFILFFYSKWLSTSSHDKKKNNNFKYLTSIMVNCLTLLNKPVQLNWVTGLIVILNLKCKCCWQDKLNEIKVKRSDQVKPGLVAGLWHFSRPILLFTSIKPDVTPRCWRRSLTDCSGLTWIWFLISHHLKWPA